MSTKISMGPEEIDFLQHSNWIENEQSEEALDDAINAWAYARDEVDNMNQEAMLEIHQLLMHRLNPRIAGRFRNVDVMVGGRMCPRSDEIDRLLTNWMYGGIEVKDAKDTAEAIRKHHVMFEHVHPFEDGNGRVGRIIYNWQRIKQGLKIHVILEDERWEYYDWFNE